MISSELLKKIRKIEIKTSHLVTDLLAGRYNSAFKGRGMEFEEVRPYMVGDDVRTIDWNVSARTGEPFIKKFREERELTVIIAVDVSGSLGFGSRRQLKRELVAELAATLAYAAIRNNDKVGLMLFTDQVECYVPPRKGVRHVLRIIRELLAFEPKGSGTDLSGALEELNRAIKRRAVVFAISDYQQEVEQWSGSMKRSALRHDLIPVVVSDEREQLMPNVGMVELEDAESGRRTILDTSRKRVRNRFAEYAREQSASRDRIFRKMRLDPIEVQTGDSFVDELTKYFQRRERRQRR
ncbi:MAG: DUF58 domain-containing protein [Planctomycetes bacterium TMED75]|nr:DUF58 domain-containing protein [Planctomycetaceae bacterium]OUU90813.1 MAG: DUF58 domain-containing protein [Planctomycetes bacterium TMED75]